MKIQQTENTVTPIGDYNQTHTQTHTLAHQQKVKQILNLKTEKKSVSPLYATHNTH